MKFINDIAIPIKNVRIGMCRSNIVGEYDLCYSPSLKSGHFVRQGTVTFTFHEIPQFAQSLQEHGMRYAALLCEIFHREAYIIVISDFIVVIVMPKVVLGSRERQRA